jgi:hypothetical protein
MVVMRVFYVIFFVVCGHAMQSTELANSHVWRVDCNEA